MEKQTNRGFMKGNNIAMMAMGYFKIREFLLCVVLFSCL